MKNLFQEEFSVEGFSFSGEDLGYTSSHEGQVEAEEEGHVLFLEHVPDLVLVGPVEIAAVFQAVAVFP